MSAKQYFSYIRVSTLRQGQIGTSLEEQRAAIKRYAERFALPLVREFEEKETAAKQGRPVFLQLLKQLKQGRAQGVVMHKIDRSARNLKDWAELGELIDRGLEVHFANEQLDLYSRGGRLSADIQAVVASDFIRNLREEVKKGIYGRLKQGLYPMPAPVGYVDCGTGQPKALDPVQAPLIRQLFELYATGKWGMVALREEMHRRGLRNRAGGNVTLHGIGHILHNSFYVGLMQIQASGETYRGVHQSLIPKSLFDRVQAIAAGKAVDRQQQHRFAYRKLLRCGECQYLLIGERQKGHTYYRCQQRHCPQKTIREERIELQLCELLRQLQFSEREMERLLRFLDTAEAQALRAQETQQQALTLQVSQLQERLSKLTDAYLEGSVEKELYLHKKQRLLGEEQALREKHKLLAVETGTVVQKTREFLELVNRAYLSYKTAEADEKRELVEIVTSNLSVQGKNLIIKPNLPFAVIAKRHELQDGRPQRTTARTLQDMLTQLLSYFASNESVYVFCSNRKQPRENLSYE